MNILTLFTTLQELFSLFNDLKSDGTIEKLQQAEQAVANELATNTKLQDLVAKAEAIFKPKG